MCGIAGIIDEKMNCHGVALAAMCDAISHRGPDDWGYLAIEGSSVLSGGRVREPVMVPATVFLGHRRLSIIDLEGSSQPLSNEDGSIWVSFNGEIYNYLELAASLRSKGHILREKGDTEVLVHLWEEYREGMLEHLSGMFALAIYDTKAGELFLARDRFGEKPLFYSQEGGVFSFASELQAFWPLPWFSGEENLLAAGQYFKYSFVPTPATIYRHVSALPPGNFLKFKNGSLSVKPYWKPSVIGVDGNWSLEELDSLIEDSVAARLMADVPLGSFLSGGIDSGLVTAAMARRSSQKVKTFTISLGADLRDESKEAAQSSSALGTEHRCFTVSPDFVAVSEMLARHYGQPFADYSAVPTYCVSSETRRFVKVALTGDGGDELFCGYERYLSSRYSRLFGIVPKFFRLPLAVLTARMAAGKSYAGQVADFVLSAGPPHWKLENHAALYHEWRQKNCFNSDLWTAMISANEQERDIAAAYYREAPSPNPIERLLEVDQRLSLSDEMLAKVDTASMAVSLECRAPLLDHRLAAYANRMPLSAKLDGTRSKAALRDLAVRRLPKGMDSLPKKGFTLPLDKWLRGPLRDWGHGMIFDKREDWNYCLRPEAVSRLWDEQQKGSRDNTMRLWSIISFVLWKKAMSDARQKHSVTLQ